MTTYVLYNPLSGSGECVSDVKMLELVLPGAIHFCDMTEISDYRRFMEQIPSDCQLILAGGDGTLNRFVNDTAGLSLPQNILYFPVGTGNDFARDVNKASYSDPFPVAAYLQDLPSVQVNGKTFRFLNAVGFGIDGYCCQVGDELRQRSSKPVNYTAIAIKGLLGGYSPTNATVTVDGSVHTYRDVWIAPAMHGRFYGGGMMAAPEQDRLAKDGKLTLMLFHGKSRLNTLRIFPSIFRGEHVKHTKHVAALRGHEITVEFDRPTPLQIDGETVLGVTHYTARSARCPQPLIHK